ncbi:hypothetical protein OEZ86_009908 [Tetradesmus obliquus]|uniref:Leucine-rich repeat-containing N-terminal plant-type domain-containing protein n=1 Tax=Tetradesmus obliquus TaxID=3088 RepID=A0ABY8UNS8_TETOB|nr:hypothetical protein OEZ85_001345 [Tetradesmus obliquus]WIA43440.1 hypothetical protein OEZ86_009908 [Tetradesmus obliquus]
MGLAGNLPQEFALLRSLKALDLSRNKLSGTIPGAFGSNGTLAGLRELNLSSNILTGPLPAEMRGLTELQKLDLSFNMFAGGLPMEWGQCSADTVDVSYNQLSEVPGSDYFSNYAKTVKVLVLRGNALNGTLPGGWGTSSLQFLDLAQNKLAGWLPPAWLDPAAGSYLQLQYINLAQNMLSGSIPAVWSNGTASLRTLILSDNPGLSGNASSMQLPTSLQALHIANTNISGSFDAGWMARQGPNFNCLVAYGSAGLCGQLDASMPCSLVNATVGTNLGKACGSLAPLTAPPSCKPSEASTCLPALAASAALLAWKAQLTDSNSTLSNWTGASPCIPGRPWPGVVCSEDRMAVVAVNVSGFGLQGPLPGGLAALSSLQVLDVSRNRLQGDLPAVLGGLSQLLVLDVSSNNFSGQLPAAWSGMSSLTRLTASHNKLQGGLPAAWGNVTFPDYNPNNQNNNGSQPGPKAMQSLTELICNNCSLSGELPFAWNNMQRLRRIHLADNSFNGLIPNLGAWQLQELMLDRNSFGSWLSPGFAGFAGAWQMLQRLSLAGCKMGGMLPAGS